MRIEKGVISSSQLMFLMAAFVQGASLLVAFTHGVTKHDTWLVVISGCAVSLPLMWAYVTLLQKFPGKNFVQINDIIYGPYLGKGISLLYLSFPMLLLTYNLQFIGDFFLTYMYPETPRIVMLIMFTAVCAWAVRSGVEVIARISLIMVAITIIVDVLTFLLLLDEMEFANFLPVFEISILDFIQGTHIMAAIPYGESVALLMIIPYANRIAQAKKAVSMGLIIGAATILILTVRDIATLGILTTVTASPSFEAVRLINIGKIITRLEVLIAIVLLITMFMRICVFYYAVVLGFAELFRLRSYRPLVLPIGMLGISLSLMSVENASEFAKRAANIAPILLIPFVLLPILTLLIAAIRRLPHKQGGQKP